MTSTQEQPGPATAARHASPQPVTRRRSQALARYAARATFGDLSAESRKQLPVHILDSSRAPSRPWEPARSTRAATRSRSSAAVTG